MSGISPVGMMSPCALKRAMAASVGITSSAPTAPRSIGEALSK